MRKLTYAPIIIALILVLAACNGPFGGSDETAKTEETTPVATRIVTETIQVAPDNSEVRTEVVTETVVERVEVSESVEGEAVRVLNDNDEIVVRYLLEDADESGTQEVFVPEDAFLTVTGEGCIESVCSENPGYVALVYGGPYTVTLQAPYGVRHANLAATLYQAGNADPMYQLAALQFADQKAMVLEFDAGELVQTYDPFVGDSDDISELFLQPLDPTGEKITFDVNFADMDVVIAEAAEADISEVPTDGAEVCGNFDGGPVIINGNVWFSTDGPMTITEAGNQPQTILGPLSGYGLNAQLTLSDYPEGTRICVNASGDYGVDGKPTHLLFGDAE